MAEVRALTARRRARQDAAHERAVLDCVLRAQPSADAGSGPPRPVDACHVRRQTRLSAMDAGRALYRLRDAGWLRSLGEAEHSIAPLAERFVPVVAAQPAPSGLPGLRAGHARARPRRAASQG